MQTLECELEQSASLVNNACIMMSIAGYVKRGVYVEIFTGDSGLEERESPANHVCILMSMVV